MLEMPTIYYIGDGKRPVEWLNKWVNNTKLEKVSIDWSTKKIRGSLPIKPEHNHPNIKKKNQMEVVWFHFSDVGKILRIDYSWMTEE